MIGALTVLWELASWEEAAACPGSGPAGLHRVSLATVEGCWMTEGGPLTQRIPYLFSVTLIQPSP